MTTPLLSATTESVEPAATGPLIPASMVLVAITLLLVGLGVTLLGRAPAGPLPQQPTRATSRPPLRSMRRPSRHRHIPARVTTRRTEVPVAGWSADELFVTATAIVRWSTTQPPRLPAAEIDDLVRFEVQDAFEHILSGMPTDEAHVLPAGLAEAAIRRGLPRLDAEGISVSHIGIHQVVLTREIPGTAWAVST